MYFHEKNSTYNDVTYDLVHFIRTTYYVGIPCYEPIEIKNLPIENMKCTKKKLFGLILDPNPNIW